MSRLVYFINILLLPSILMAAEGDGSHGPDFMGLVWRIIVFVVFVAILYKFLKEPLINFLDDRTNQIEESIEMAEKAKENAEVELTNYKLKLQQMEKELETMKLRAKKQADLERESILEDAKNNIAKLRKSTEDMIQSDLDRAKAELRQEAAKLSLELAEQKIQKRLTGDMQKRLAKKYIAKMGVTN